MFAATLGGAQGRPASSVGYRWPSTALSRRKGSLCRTVVDSGARDTRWLVPEGAVSTISFLCASIFLKGNQGTWWRVELTQARLCILDSPFPFQAPSSHQLLSLTQVTTSGSVDTCSVSLLPTVRLALPIQSSFELFFSVLTHFLFTSPPWRFIEPYRFAFNRHGAHNHTLDRDIPVAFHWLSGKDLTSPSWNTFLTSAGSETFGSWANLNLTTNYCDRRHDGGSPSIPTIRVENLGLPPILFVYLGGYLFIGTSSCWLRSHEDNPRIPIVPGIVQHTMGMSTFCHSFQ